VDLRDGPEHLVEQLLQPPAVFVEGLVQCVEPRALGLDALLLLLGHALHLVERQPARQLRVALDLPAEVVARRQRQNGRPAARRAEPEQLYEGRVLVGRQRPGQRRHGLPLGLRESRLVAISRQLPDPPGQCLRVHRAVEIARLSRGPQFLESLRPELRPLRAAGQLVVGADGVEELPHLVAERLVLRAPEDRRAAAPQRVPRQRDFEHLPRALVALAQDGRELAAVVREPVGEEADDQVRRPVGGRLAGHHARHADGLAHGQRGESEEDAHRGMPEKSPSNTRAALSPAPPRPARWSRARVTLVPGCSAPLRRAGIVTSPSPRYAGEREGERGLCESFEI
jgi:hypothetical protein